MDPVKLPLLSYCTSRQISLFYLVARFSTQCAIPSPFLLILHVLLGNYLQKYFQWLSSDFLSL